VQAARLHIFDAEPPAKRRGPFLPIEFNTLNVATRQTSIYFVDNCIEVQDDSSRPSSICDLALSYLFCGGLASLSLSKELAMSEMKKPNCPECTEPESLGRRDFIRVLGGTTAGLAAGTLAAPRLLAQQATATTTAAVAVPARAAAPAEDLVRELFAGLSAEQKTQVVYPLDHGGANPTRLRMFNAPFARNIGQVYTQPQQELVQRILRAMSSDDEGYRRLTRNNTFDGSQSLQGCGAYIFGDPTNNQRFSYVFMGHHLTVRCDGNSEPGAAFGGPMYYGHSPDGYSQRNVFNYQTQRVKEVFDALSAEQRGRAVLDGNPGEQIGSVQFRDRHPGLVAADLTADQRRLVEAVMRDILQPYRREDADEVMQIVRQNGGLERLHLAFYRDRGTDDARWHFWRLEGPGFVWNYRVLPHVHTFVNIAART